MDIKEISELLFGQIRTSRQFCEYFSSSRLKAVHCIFDRFRGVDWKFFDDFGDIVFFEEDFDLVIDGSYSQISSARKKRKHRRSHRRGIHRYSSCLVAQDRQFHPLIRLLTPETTSGKASPLCCDTTSSCTDPGRCSRHFPILLHSGLLGSEMRAVTSLTNSLLRSNPTDAAVPSTRWKEKHQQISWASMCLHGFAEGVRIHVLKGLYSTDTHFWVGRSESGGSSVSRCQKRHPLTDRKEVGKILETVGSSDRKGHKSRLALSVWVPNSYQRRRDLL